MAYWQPVPGQAVPGAVEPHGYTSCSLPPAAGYSHSASLGRKPPSQMQNAYASYQFTQLIGRFSWLPPEVAVHVEYGEQEVRFAVVGSTSVALFQSVASQPVS